MPRHSAHEAITAVYAEAMAVATLLEQRTRQVERYLELALAAGDALAEEWVTEEERVGAVVRWKAIRDLGHDVAVGKKEAPTPQSRARIDYQQGANEDDPMR